MMESETDKSYSQSTLQQTSQKRLSSNDAAIMQREREITDIAKGIIELADIFKELQTMVIDQGTMLDRIDYNVERMAVDVKAADKELTVVCPNHFHAPILYNKESLLTANEQATGYQRKTTKRKILLLLLLLVVGMFIVLLVKPKRHTSTPPAAPLPPKPTPDTKSQAIPNSMTQAWSPSDNLPNTFEAPSRLSKRLWHRPRKRPFP